MGTLMLFAAGALLSAALITPAIAHNGSVAHLWQKHVKPKADVRYLQNTKVYVSETVSVAAAYTVTATVDCPVGMQAIGGGVDTDADSLSFSVVSSAPTIGGESLLNASAGKNPSASGWSASVENLDALSAHDIAVGVICSK